MDPSLPLMYDWVRRTREDLFEYTASLPNDVYLRAHPELPYGSIRDIHAHVAYAYLWWVGRFGIGLEPFDQQTETLRLNDVNAMRGKFREVDAVLERAFEQFDRLDEPLEVIRPGRDRFMVTQRWLIVRPITHEFHHKGQLLTLGRMLGHPLPDDAGTDLVLPYG